MAKWSICFCLRGCCGPGSVLCAMCVPVKEKVGGNWSLGSVLSVYLAGERPPGEMAKGPGATPGRAVWAEVHSVWPGTSSLCPGTLAHLLDHGRAPRDHPELSRLMLPRCAMLPVYFLIRLFMRPGDVEDQAHFRQEERLGQGRPKAHGS